MVTIRPNIGSGAGSRRGSDDSREVKGFGRILYELDMDVTCDRRVWEASPEILKDEWVASGIFRCHFDGLMPKFVCGLQRLKARHDIGT